MENLHVIKFGGTSLQDAAAICQAAKIVRSIEQPLVVVVSAMGGVTDILLKGSHEASSGRDFHSFPEEFLTKHRKVLNDLPLDPKSRATLNETVSLAAEEFKTICESFYTLKEYTQKSMDHVVARGERIMARLFAAHLCETPQNAAAEGFANVRPAVYVDAAEIIRVKIQFGNLLPDVEKCHKLCSEFLKSPLAQGKIVVVPGFIGRDEQETLVTLGRGGSDFSATIIAEAIGATRVILYKEVEGIMTADPRFVSEARVVPALHFREATELAYYGAKVLHPRTIIPLVKNNISLTLKNTFFPERAGTTISHTTDAGPYPVKALTAIASQTLVAVEGKGMMGVPGIAGRVFNALAQAHISVSMISQASSEASICFVVPDDQSDRAVSVLSEEFVLERAHGLIEPIGKLSGQAVLAVVGLGMKGTQGTASRTFSALGKGGINIEAIAQGSSELNISMVIDGTDVALALNALHREFRLEKIKILPHIEKSQANLVLFGFGQIARTLCHQLAAQKPYFKEKMNIDCRVLGISDRSGILICENTFSMTNLLDLTRQKVKGIPIKPTVKPMDISAIIPLLKRDLWPLSVKNGIFVDLTAAATEEVIASALKEGFDVVLANKKPLAVAQKRFDDLFALAASRSVQLRYEATVGAGLPILDTIEKLKEAGDEISSILGCLSGTLSFIMSELEEGTAFSAAVKKAHGLGFTEPDPRDDLTGVDVARKALILARTLGVKLDITDFKVEPLFPPSTSNDEPLRFLENLKSLDQEWHQRIASAKKNGMCLRYVARIDRIAAKVSVDIEEVAKDHPLSQIKGTDNQVVIRTRMYDKNPLVLTGPGAGAEVTASGVLNDIIAIAATREM